MKISFTQSAQMLCQSSKGIIFNAILIYLLSPQRTLLDITSGFQTATLLICLIRFLVFSFLFVIITFVISLEQLHENCRMVSLTNVFICFIAFGFDNDLAVSAVNEL